MSKLRASLVQQASLPLDSCVTETVSFVMRQIALDGVLTRYEAQARETAMAYAGSKERARWKSREAFAAAERRDSKSKAMIEEERTIAAAKTERLRVLRIRKQGKDPI
jgi:hypothetical protein